MRSLGFLVTCCILSTAAKSHYHSSKQGNTDPAHEKQPIKREQHSDDIQRSPKSQQQTTGVDWMARGQQELNVALNSWPKWQRARNVIYFIGDGMGVSTLTAGRIFKAQREGQSVTEAKLSWEQFPYIGAIKTYNTDQQTPDSAGTATAFACGEKTRAGMISVNENVEPRNCSMVSGNELRSIVHYSQDEGKWAGIVSTAKITDATPAAAFAHAASRNWTTDGAIPEEDQATCWDIARQLVHDEDNKQLRVVLGGGRSYFFSESTFDHEYPTVPGLRTDGRDLRQEWLDIKAAGGLSENAYSYVENKTSFENVEANSTEYLFGMFEPEDMKYEADRSEETGDTWTEPSLAEMVKKSLDILKRGPDGYMLYVEGGRIDHGHHANNAYRALYDVIALQDAVQVAMDETDEEDTLIILTADHSHVFTIAGDAYLDNDILGIAVTRDGWTQFGDDGKPWTTLSYGNGPGFVQHRTVDGDLNQEIPRIDLTGVQTNDKDFIQDSAVPLPSDTHGGEDVLVYARGPMANLFSGQHEQHYIAHAAMYASCVGWNKDFCQSNPPPPGGS